MKRIIQIVKDVDGFLKSLAKAINQVKRYKL